MTTCKDHSGLIEANAQQERRLTGIEDTLKDVRSDQVILKVELSKLTVKIGVLVSALLPAWNAIINACTSLLPKIIKVSSMFFP